MIEKRSTRIILRWKKSDRGSSHVRHGLDPRLIFGFTFSNQVRTPDIYGAHWNGSLYVD